MNAMVKEMFANVKERYCSNISLMIDITVNKYVSGLVCLLIIYSRPVGVWLLCDSRDLYQW